MSHPSLTDAESERLEMLIEECSEIIQSSTKILRHGYESYHPKEPTTNNRQQLQDEVCEAIAILKKMNDSGDVDFSIIQNEDHIYNVWLGKLRWTHHQDG